MPGANLTRVEAEERKSIVQYPIQYSVDLDLTQGDTTFVSTSTIQFGAKAGESTFLDLIAENMYRYRKLLNRVRVRSVTGTTRQTIAARSRKLSGRRCAQLSMS